MIWYLPLEILDKRYTQDMDLLIQRAFEEVNIEFTTIWGKPLSKNIEIGAFLDANSTNYFKFRQLEHLVEAFGKKLIRDGDTIFVSDLWFPGIEAIKYMAYFNHINVKVAGVLHAGSWTETDFVANLKSWSQHYEKMLSEMTDAIFFGSNFSKSEFISKGRAVRYDNMFVTGIPFDPMLCYERVPYKPWKEKENIVVFNGRLNDEKQPWLFDRLEEQLPRFKFVKTMEKRLTKKTYYELLSRAKVVFSAALQENFGFGILEACTYGCRIVVPDDLSYQELYPKKYRYMRVANDISIPKEMIKNFMTQTKDPEDLVKIASEQKENAYNIVKLLLK